MLAFPMKVLYFILGLAAAGGTIAYGTGLLDRFFQPAPQLAETPPADGGAPAQIAAVPEKADRPKAPAGTVPQPEAPATPETPPPAKAAADIVVPRFDILRVEPDGSLLIAGTAAAEAAVEVVSGTKVLSKTNSNAAGEFVAVLEDRLAPGDYQIVLRSTTADNVVATSIETAVVSIPETKAGQVLAIVEQPGAPSRLITVPVAEAPVAPAEEPAKAPPQAAEQPQAPAAQEPAAVAEQPAAPAQEETPPATAANEPEPATPAPAQPGTQDVAAIPAAPAAPGGAVPPSSVPASPESAARVVVEAVEIEGRKIFVAGMAAPDRYVRVYANELLLGESRVSPGGRFLVEAERDLPVGDYIIRVDLLADNRSTVIARAAVPFQREAGENIAAVAPQQPPAPVETPAVPAGTPPSPGTPAQTPPEPAGGTAAAEAPAAPDAPKVPEVAAVAEAPPPAAEPEVVLSPQLERADSAVIIRRGDTLWRISRRVYGKGVRYSTIYLANQDQIENPDRIWPGQVFAMPGESADGTKANWDALGNQLTEKSGVN